MTIYGEDANCCGGSGHIPVLCREVISSLSCGQKGIFVDCTFGSGGHSRAILESNRENRVIALDKDADAVESARAVMNAYRERFSIVKAGFETLGDILSSLKISRVNGFVFDLGMSSLQLDSASRGFSFRFDSELDMRFDKSRGETAADFLNGADEKELLRVFSAYGEEPRSLAIARAVITCRKKSPLRTTNDLVLLIERIKGPKRKKIHPATKIFQALRIYVNNELENLKTGLAQAFHYLETGGRIAVISFHSLEDRIVKRYFSYLSKKCICPPGQPICTCNKEEEARAFKLIRPGEKEIKNNPRSRSAKLRIVEKINKTGGKNAA
ncbi:16S rRNA (cytosine(1402)-N(4))-methyltransferase RsmH [bacterium]|jgi:16S rRNA (cytosine1402-N4)-methyltransferase|nr:16S rRNA (cytosine(1402)-N(4))-methyltransferase RsmH [bacterium]